MALSLPAQAELLLSGQAERPSSLARAAALLRSDITVAFPTETVYGLGGNALSTTAVQRIFDAKGRPADNPLIVHVADTDMLQKLVPGGSAAIPAVFHKLMDTFWPGPLTLIVPLDPRASPPELDVSPLVTAGQPSVGVRMPAHPLARDLIRETGLPLAAPSANLSSRPSPTTAQHVMHDLGQGRGVGAVLDGGPCDVGVESTVVDYVAHEHVVRVLRAGGVSPEQIETCLANDGPGSARVSVFKRDFRDAELESAPTTPGMKYKHYAPLHARVVLVRVVHDDNATPDDEGDLPPKLSEAIFGASHLKSDASVGLLLSRASLDSLPRHVLESQRAPRCFNIGDEASEDVDADASARATARALFASLRAADDERLATVFVECLDEHGLGLAVMERARKAAGGAAELVVRPG